VQNIQQKSGLLADFEQLEKTHVTTVEAANLLGRRPQTLRGWACSENGPQGLRPRRVHGRLAWNLDEIRTLLGLAQ
jgi:hypothetical protein